MIRGLQEMLERPDLTAEDRETLEGLIRLVEASPEEKLATVILCHAEVDAEGGEDADESIRLAKIEEKVKSYQTRPIIGRHGLQ